MSEKIQTDGVRAKREANERKIFLYLKRRAATCDEVMVALNMQHQVASPRVHDLAKRGAIVDTGKKRMTRLGRPAVVYKAAS